MKTFSFFLSFFLSFSLLGQCPNVVTDPLTGLPSETPDNLECIEAANRIIAEYFSPIIHHMTDVSSNRSVGGRADLLTSIFYDVDLDNVSTDEDLSTGNNWNNLENYPAGNTINIDAFDPYVYYSVVWTENYWIVAYGYYHSRDWAGGSICCPDNHENDYEASIFVINRNDYTLKGAFTVFHNELLKYSTKESDLTNNPNVFIDDRTHGVVMDLQTGDCIRDGLNPCDACKDFNLSDPESHVTYRRVGEDGDAYVNTTLKGGPSPPPFSEYRLYGEGRYILEDVFGSHEFSLYNQRDNPFVFMGSTNGSFYTDDEENCEEGTASAPWGFGNFMHTREDIEYAICFAETGNHFCYPTPSNPLPPTFDFHWPALIEHNPYFPTQCGVETFYTSDPHFTLSEDYTWDLPEDWVIGKSIVVQNGATLTVNNRTMYFAPGTGLIVKDGGRLIANNATFDICPQALGDAKWRGISSPYDPLLNVIGLVNNTTIKNAETGLLLGYGSGIVVDGIAPTGIVNGASFIDNNIGIHTSYNQNGSSGVSAAMFKDNDIGISLIGGSEILRVVNCDFEDNDIGISAFDSPLLVRSSSTFDGGRIGILTGATSSMTSNVMIGLSSSGGGNTFENLDKGIFSMGGGATFGISVLNNKFYNIRENAVQIRGESSFTIANNSFGDDGLGGNRRGLEVMASGSDINRIQCNVFTQNEVVDNVLAGVNNNTRFLENDYSTDAQFKNIAWFATLPNMGSAALSAANCFNDDAGSSPDIASLNSNDFRYFYKNSNECQEQEPNEFSNVSEFEADGPGNYCSNGIGPFNFIDPGNGNSGQVDINTFDADLVCEFCILDSIEYYKNQIIANGGSNPYTGIVSVETPTFSLVKKEQLFEQWVNFGLFVANEKKDYDFAENILSPLNDWKWKTRYYGLSLQKEDFSEAANRLAALPNTNTNQAAFRRAQEVNLKYLTAKALGTENQITQEDLENLRDIGLSYEPSNGYARTLLFLLTGEELPTLIPEREEFIESSAKAEKKEGAIVSRIPNKTISVFPNPAKDYIQLESKSILITNVVLMDIYGKRIIIKATNEHSIRIETTGINTGIYLVQLQLENGKLITQKIIIED